MSNYCTAKRLVTLWELAHVYLAQAIVDGDYLRACLVADEIDSIELDLLTCGVAATPRHGAGAVRGQA